MIFWRVIVRLIGVLFVVTLALGALAIAAYSLDGVIKLGSLRPDRLLGLVTVRDRVGSFLTQLARPGDVAALSLLCGAGAVLLGNSLSGYQTLYREAAGLHASDFTRKVRLIAGIAGLIVFLVLIFLAFQELPRPYLARGEITLSAEDTGTLKIEPRAIERIAEISARAHKDVASAAGRLGDKHLNVSVSLRRASTLAETLHAVRDSVGEDLARHDLPALPVNVTATGYDPKNRRQLS